MRFRTNDWLVHPQYGVGRVVQSVKKKIGQGERQEYYEISISTGTVWVPVEGHSNRLRKVTPKDDLGRYRGVLKGRPKPLASDHKERQTTLVERLKKGTLQAKCEVVRDLMAFRWNKSLNESSNMILRSTHLFLCSEWAAAEGLSIDEATHEIDALLLEGKVKYEHVV